MQGQIDRIFALIDEPVVADRAIALIKKRASQETLTQNEKRLLNYLDNLLAGRIPLETYLGADKQFGR
ncbi:MAG: hypothetical protein AAB393_03910 [Bacteroidota bacterium]